MSGASENPNSPQSLVERLRDFAQRQPDRVLYTFLPNAESEGIELRYRDADARARALAVRLREHAKVGDRALLLYPSSLEYPVAFLACLYAGITAVPAYPPDPKRARQTLPRVLAIARDCGARLILTTQGLREVCELAREQAPDPSAIEVITTDDVDASGADAWSMPDQLGDQLAFLQYTSGSTGAPKGVMVPHRTLIEHQRLAHEIFRRTGEQITVSWLPFYHDMGLIGSLLYPLYTGGHTVLMPPTSFIRRPMQWLHNITKYRAAVSTAPNFAYELCIRRSTEDDLERLDLSCWELTVCGAEPLRASTLERFTERFGRCGFRVETFLPCYGGAEATLTMSGGDVTAAPVIRSFDAAALRENRVVEVEPTEPATPPAPGTRRYVACGQPMQEHELRVVDPESGRELPEDRVGELWLRGPSIASGYWGQAERTAEAFAATLPELEGARFMRTGDLGFWHDGEVYVIGRLADRLVIDGKRHEPHDLELTIEDAEPSLVYGTAAAIDPHQKGELWFVAEVRKTTEPEDLDRIGAEIRALLRAGHDVEATKVLLVPPRIVPRTSSGKIRRHAYAHMLGTGELVPLWEG